MLHHQTNIELSRITENYGFEEETQEENLSHATKEIPYSRLDRAILTRIAIAMEDIAGSLSPKRRAEDKKTAKGKALVAKRKDRQQMQRDRIFRLFGDPKAWLRKAEEAGYIPPGDDYQLRAGIRILVENFVKWKHQRCLPKSEIRALLNATSAEEFYTAAIKLHGIGPKRIEAWRKYAKIEEAHQ